MQTKSGHFDPEKFEDHYEKALRDMIKRKAAGKEITAPKPVEHSNVINLMDALKRSVAAERGEKHGASSGKAPSARRASSAKRAREPAKKARKAG